MWVGECSFHPDFQDTCIYNSHVPFVKEQLHDSKPTVSHWTKHDRAFQKIRKDLSYVQVLLKNINVRSSDKTERIFEDFHKSILTIIGQNASEL